MRILLISLVLLAACGTAPKTIKEEMAAAKLQAKAEGRPMCAQDAVPTDAEIYVETASGTSFKLKGTPDPIEEITVAKPEERCHLRDLPSMTKNWPDGFTGARAWVEYKYLNSFDNKLYVSLMRECRKRPDEQYRYLVEYSTDGCWRIYLPNERLRVYEMQTLSQRYSAPVTIVKKEVR